MKRLSLLALLLILATSLSSQTIRKTYFFPVPLLKSSGEYTELAYPECKNFSPEGQPLLPWLSVELLLPQGMEATRVNIIEITYHNPINGITLKPANRYFPISEPAPADYSPVPDESIYNSDRPFPVDQVVGLNSYFISGHPVATMAICPVQYIPLPGTINPIQSITVEVTSEPTARARASASFLKGDPQVVKRIDRLVDNPETRSSYQYPASRNGSADLLVITSNALLPECSEYISFKKSQGFIIITETVEDIYAGYSGQDNQDKIRNCIIGHFQNEGIQYVLLVGDGDTQSSTDNIIPSRGLTAYDDNNIPADMYYACLDGNWNNDGDNKWGEPGEDDLLAEVSIGRLCVDNAAELQNMVNKLILYQDSPVVADIEKALMLGENLDGVPTWGGDSKDEIVEGSSNYGYSTAGISENFEITRLYDRDYIWNKNSIFQEFNVHGTHLLNHLGHSNVTYNMKMDNSSITTGNFTNNGVDRGYVIGYSQGCYNGSFDNRGTSSNAFSAGDCFAEAITTLETAEVATIANSRYGWYSPGQTNGPSQYFDREFFDAIFGEGFTEIGFANGDSKEDNVGYITSDQIGRWCAYELNVFGDPSMDIWTAVPEEIAVGCSPVIAKGATGFRIFTDAPGARIGLLQDDELIGRGFAGDDGTLDLSLFEAVSSGSDIEVSVMSHNHLRYTTSIEVIEDQPYVVFNSLVINDPAGNGNGKADYGETIVIDVEMTNIGDQPATAVQCTLSSGNEFIYVDDDGEAYGDIDPGQSVTIQGAFSFTIDSLAPWHTASFNIESSTGEWVCQSSFLSEILAPDLKYDGFTIYDESGNDNGRIDPGESVSLEITIVNNGSSDAMNVAGELSSLSGYLMVEEGDVVYGDLPAGQSSSKMFAVTADPDCPDGFQAVLELMVQARGGITFTDSLKTFVGQPPVLVLDLDNNRNSGPEMYQTIVDLGVGAEYYSNWPAELASFDAIFLSLGTLWNNHMLTKNESDLLVDYLDNGGNLYLEGSGAWYFDPDRTVHDMFNIEGTFGTIELGPVSGVPGSFSEEMTFQYEGDSLYWDQIIPVEPAFLILRKDDPFCGLGAAHDAGDYKTIGVSFEFGGLQDGEGNSPKAALMEKYLEFFGLLGDPVGIANPSSATGEISLAARPNPFRDRVTIDFQVANPCRVSISVSNLAGMTVATIFDGYADKGDHQVNWPDNSLNPGIYLLRLTTETTSITRKIVVF